MAKSCRQPRILETGQIAWITGAIAKHDNGIKTLRLGSPRHGQAHEQQGGAQPTQAMHQRLAIWNPDPCRALRSGGLKPLTRL